MASNGKNALHLATHSGWYRFERRAEDWVQADRALTYWQMSCVQVDPGDPKRVYIGTEHSGMFVTNDGGKDWIRANPNVPCLTMSSMLALPGKLLVGTMPAALYYTNDGSGWQELKGVRQGAAGGTFPPNPDFPARTRVLTNEKTNGGRLFAGIEVAGILVSDDDGQSWQPANDGLTDPDIHQILPSKKLPGLVVTACGEGVSRSTDRGSCRASRQWRWERKLSRIWSRGSWVVRRLRTRGQNRRGLGARQALIFSLEKKQRAFTRSAGVDNLSDHDGVIAAIVGLGNNAFDIAHDTFDDRGAIAAGLPLQICKFVRPFSGKAPRNLLLIFAQKINRKPILQSKAAVTSCPFVHADQHQRRI